MRSIILPLLLTGCAAQSIVREGPAFTYRTSKRLPALEKCLTATLSKVDDVTAVASGGTTTLMLGPRTNPRMLLDLAPPKVAVTTQFEPGTRDLIESCI
jgi:hypothetical protein